MHILLPWQEPSLADWHRRPVHDGCHQRPLHAFDDELLVDLAQEEKGAPQPDGPFERVERSILSYRIFGPRLGTPTLASEPVEVGQTVGLRYHFLPGLSLFFASRVVAKFEREPTPQGFKSGFTYRTVQGHPEFGEESFLVYKDPASGRVRLHIYAWSRPGLLWTWLALPWSRHIQKRAGAQAVAFLSSQMDAAED